MHKQRLASLYGIQFSLFFLTCIFLDFPYMLCMLYSRDRNREHARNTRIRKKQYIENLKLQIGEMLQSKARDERDAILNSSRESASVRVFFWCSGVVSCDSIFVLTARLACSEASCYSGILGRRMRYFLIKYFHNPASKRRDTKAELHLRNN